MDVKHKTFKTYVKQNKSAFHAVFFFRKTIQKSSEGVFEDYLLIRKKHDVKREQCNELYYTKERRLKGRCFNNVGSVY